MCMRMLSMSACLLSLVSTGCPRPPKVLPSAVSEPPFEERLRMGWFQADSIAARISGYVDLDWDMPRSCRYTVWLTDPATQAERARAVLAPVAERCPADPRIYVEKSDFSREDITRIRQRIELILQGAGEQHRGIGFRRGRLFVNALNPAQRDRLATLMKSHDRELPLSQIDLNLQGPPYELDPPVQPPAAVYRAIADSLPPRAKVDTTELSAAAIAALRARGIQLTAGECGTRSFRLGQARGWDDDRYVISRIQQPPAGGVVWLVTGRFYEVQCTRDTCRVKGVFAMGDFAVSCRPK